MTTTSGVEAIPASEASDLLQVMEALTGQPTPIEPSRHLIDLLHRVASETTLGYSQLNELLLLLGYDRVTPSFFQYLAVGTTEYHAGSEITSFAQLREGVERFQQLALLFFGNVKFAYKRFSQAPSELERCLALQEPRDESSFEARHEAIQPVDRIPGSETFYLGYLVARDIQDRLIADPADAGALADEERRRRIVDAGKRNHQAYLASDHLDVYVATSMRQRHEYLLVSDLSEQIFSHRTLRKLKLRWFDPTQAYCSDRIDKGLAEALMLKRAKCTLYFAQESDTLGKDSELASTLAQGKPVVAFVPRGDVDLLLERLRVAYPGRDQRELVLSQLRLFAPDLAWDDRRVRAWLDCRFSEASHP